MAKANNTSLTSEWLTASLNVILNVFQDLSAEKDKKRLAVRC